ncbi:chromosome segregation in meiosis-related protein [Elasticomyces elasticus]|nr:chromosome segregation in meiosis-related protein [Elasticomyces elasticus]KAK3668313.1 chromosome segregation in meiosis-related protein [Elasticomyces elasticus]KAK4910990.1 chromosome segregation in meiosis-related protein [Elasticomyces elasticus]KAK5756464.1 chromosome segregation in meiosis-related protein [Elasticomyces elasticus]
MPSATSPTRAGSPDRYQRDVDEFLRDFPVNNEAPNNNTAPAADPDAEIKVRKKRAPALKLDENLLLSPAGIPKFRVQARKQLKFKGKGHEFSDIGRLLNLYQLWLDDLYPKAKFRDGLAMVEKIGHGKRMAVMRRGWMDGGGHDGMDDLFGEQPRAQGEGERSGNADVEMPEEDELDALMGGSTDHAPRPQPQQPVQGMFEDDDGPDDDELDALMAETATISSKPVQPQSKRLPFEQDDDEDDEDALDALMAETGPSGSASRTTNIARPSGPFQEEDDQDELDALLAEHS